MTKDNKKNQLQIKDLNAKNNHQPPKKNPT